MDQTADARAPKRSAQQLHISGAHPTNPDPIPHLAFPPAVGVGGGSESDAHEPDAPQPPRKRKRRVISCAECHRRKQKCDRGLPCKACVDRNMEASCHYETVAMSRERHHTRIIEAAAYGRALQEGGTIQIKTVGFGYAQTSANTLGFLHKIDGGPPGGGRNNEIGSETGSTRLAGTVSEDAAARSSGASAQDDDLRQPSSSSASPTRQQQQQQQHSSIPDQRRLQRPHVGDPYGLGDRYRALVRELPSRANIDHLAELYFRYYNWNYYAIDEDVFVKQLGDWMDIALGPFSAPHSPVQMSPDLRAFPALLFNVIAMGLLMLDTSKKDDMAIFESIKRPNCETFEDLALEYSETGMAVLSLLGKRQMSYTTVLAGFSRSAFLKYAALITEAWHALGIAIRDAQEVGLHRSDMDPKPWAQTAEAVLENQWEIQRRRRLWMTLVSWDLHMGIVLGRPITVDLSLWPVKPVDCVLPKTFAQRSTMAVQPRTADDPPTPLSSAIWAYDAIMPLRSIVELEKKGPCPRNFAGVDDLHKQLVDIESSTPPCFRLENPDTRFDNLPDTGWLRSVRATIPQITIFNFMALHRQYIFTRPASRTEALKACIRMLQVQRVYFAGLRPQQYKTFSLFFGTFDSLVLLATIYILFPKEHHDLLPEAIQHYRWSMERFEIMREHYGLARSALSVLHANYVRMRKVLGRTFVENAVDAAPVDPSMASPIDASLKREEPATAGSGAVSTNLNTDDMSGVLSHDPASFSAGSDIFGLSNPSTAPTVASFASALPTQQPPADPAANNSLESIFPTDFNWQNLPTMCPTGDITYNILTGVSDKSVMGMPADATGLSSSEVDDANNAAARAAVQAARAVTAVEEGDEGKDSLFFPADGAPEAWQFEGDFSSFSVWGLLNQYC